MSRLDMTYVLRGYKHTLTKCTLPAQDTLATQPCWDWQYMSSFSCIHCRLFWHIICMSCVHTRTESAALGAGKPAPQFV